MLPVRGPIKLENKMLSGAEELPVAQGDCADIGAIARTRLEPHTSIRIDNTRYDYQHNGSMGRQVVYTYTGSLKYCGVHFVWMCLPCSPCVPPAFRHVRYNAVDCNGNWAWPIDLCGGNVIELENAG